MQQNNFITLNFLLHILQYQISRLISRPKGKIVFNRRRNENLQFFIFCWECPLSELLSTSSWPWRSLSWKNVISKILTKFSSTLWTREMIRYNVKNIKISKPQWILKFTHKKLNCWKFNKAHSSSIHLH